MRGLLPVVEGPGDIKAVPELIRRVAYEHHIHDIEIAAPHKRGDLPKVLSTFETSFQVALLEKLPILWVLDYDDGEDQAAEVEALRARANNCAFKASPAFEFVFMVKEFESLFLADHETTRKVFADIPPDFVFPVEPEKIRGAKELLSKARPKGFAYKETEHQQKLAAQVDLARLRLRSPSFVRIETAVLKLLKASL